VNKPTKEAPTEKLKSAPDKDAVDYGKVPVPDGTPRMETKRPA